MCLWGWISIIEQLTYNLLWNEGNGTNNKVEAMVLWGLLWFTNFLNIPILHVYGDTKIIIEHVLGKTSINNLSLLGWMKRIEVFWQLQDGYSIQYIGRSQNVQVDSLSKKGLLQKYGK